MLLWLVTATLAVIHAVYRAASCRPVLQVAIPVQASASPFALAELRQSARRARWVRHA
ncbi:hypothetical protein OHAE_761 [Ochrobactrum soli]|uniref:Uncharacterized protein n=1 Tax=Ochrobactrum soli TaxID=2448455 RepID=A0A2P9HL96_9HYPH|nr:hypothetical protein OHAE_761 [[Ochrobactrum] soli]